jgi:transforming growth factor-beta-induced protein
VSLTQQQIVAPSNAAFDNIPYTSLNGVWDEKDAKKTISLLQYHILQGTIATAGLPSGPSFFKATILYDKAWTNVTSGQNVIVVKQPGDVVVFTSSLGTRVTVTKGDIPFSGGLIQIIDNFMIPPARLEKTSDAFKLPAFLGGLYTAGLMPQFAEQPNVTIFAPRNEAMSLVAGSLQGLDPANLVRTFSYHIIPGQVLALSALTNGTNLTTAAAASSAGTGAGPLQQIHLRQSGNDLFVNSARVIQPDILIANGVIHVIDNVLNPDVPAVLPNPSIASQPPVFGVSTRSGLPFTTALPCTANCPVPTTSTITRTSTRTAATNLNTGTSKGGAGQPRATGFVAGAAAGMLGVGMGFAILG